MPKPNCYECAYRQNVPGDAHSQCAHPVHGGDSLRGLADLILGKNPLNISGAAHGIKMGWFLWPINFDPVWLENCDGFKSKNPPQSAGEKPPEGLSLL